MALDAPSNLGLRPWPASPHRVGLDITIHDPDLDPDLDPEGSAGALLAVLVVSAFAES
ncbi:hypothetical protein [Streptomyces sp. NPDC088350]|uniref:hypothetical protein n=1 Tax=Streptomyces sp. NPDC088350 TaxID=3365854 RepID=UPI0037F8C81C